MTLPQATACFPFTNPSLWSDRGRAWLALAAVAPAACAAAIAGLVFGKGQAATVIWALSKLWLVAVPIAWRLFVDRKPLSLSPARRGGLAAGAVVGLVSAIAIVAAYLLVGRGWIDPSVIRATLAETGLLDPRVYFGVALFWVVGNSALEETTYRWFLVSQSRPVLGLPGAVAFAAGVFVLHHAIAMAIYFGWQVTILGSVGLFVGSAVWSVLYHRTGSLQVAWLSHAIADVAVFVIGAVLLFG